MAIDKLQDKIRKLKNPLALDLDMLPEHIPPQLLTEADGFLPAYSKFCKDIMFGLKDTIPAVRFHLNTLALLGTEGIFVLSDLLSFAKRYGYYTILDTAESTSAQNAERAATLLFDGDLWQFDGLVVSAYIGSDALKPYAERSIQNGKDLFVVARTSNKTATEIQDLLSGGRLVHMAMADVVNRFAEPTVGRCGYSPIALLAAAASADCLRTLRSKFPHIFLLLDGFDYPNANAKNCSFAFDKLGHGAMAVAGSYIYAAWQGDCEPDDYVACAVSATERLKKNLNRYVTIL